MEKNSKNPENEKRNFPIHFRREITYLRYQKEKPLLLELRLPSGATTLEDKPAQRGEQLTHPELFNNFQWSGFPHCSVNGDRLSITSE